MALKVPKVPDSGVIANPAGVENMLGFYNDQATFNKSLKTLLDGTIVDSRDWEMIFAEDGDYSLALNAAHAMTITSVTTKTSAGTATVTVKINGVALGGTANSASTSEQTQAHTTTNEAAAGDDITLTVSANSGAENLRVAIHYTRPLIV
jgi:hypothetical protein